MTPTRAAALEAVAEAVRLWRDHKSPSRLSDLLHGIHILDALPAEPEPEGEMVEVWGYVRTDSKGYVNGRIFEEEKHARHQAQEWGCTENGPLMGTVFSVRIPRPVVPEVVAEVVKP